MALLAGVEPTIHGTDPEFVAADPAGDEFPADDRTVVQVRNDDISPKTVTVVSRVPAAPGVAPDDVEVPAGSTVHIRIKPASRFVDRSGRARITYSDTTDLSVAVTQGTPGMAPRPISLGVPLLGGHSVQASGLALVSLFGPIAAQNPDLAQGLAVGDTMLAVVVWDGSGGATLAVPSGQEAEWLDLVPQTTLGTRRLRVLARDRRPGDPATYDFNLSVNASHRAVLAVIRGAGPPSEWKVGPVGTRAGGSGTPTTTIAPSVTITTADNRVLNIAAEASSAGSGPGELVSVTGADLWFFAEQGGAGSGAIETVAVADTEQVGPGVSPPVTFTYAQVQNNNGAAVKVSAPGRTIPGGGYQVAHLLRQASPENPFIVAHRCNGGWWPENTLYAAEQAVLAGATWIDVDVVRTADGVFALHHDLNTLRMTGVDIDIQTATWPEIRGLMNNPVGCVDTGQPPRPMGRLEEVLDAFADRCVISIELKGSSAGMPDLLAVMDRYPDSKRRLVFQVPAGGQAQLTAAHNAGYTTWANAENDEVIQFPGRFGANVDLIGLNHDAGPANWAATVALGKPVIGYIIGSQAQAQTALDNGASGLTVSRW